MRVLREIKNVAILLVGMLIGALLVVALAFVQLVMWPFEKPLGPKDVVAYLRDCVEGTLSDVEIDSFAGLKISDPRLRQIMDDLYNVPDDWTTPEAIDELQKLLKRAEAIADESTHYCRVRGLTSASDPLRTFALATRIAK